MVLNAKLLRNLSDEEAKILRKERRHNPAYIILEDVLDTYNIGGFFRLADAIAAEKIYLCGTSALPPNHRIVKASVGAYRLVDWEHCETAIEAIAKLKVKQVKVIAVEQNKNSKDYRKISKALPMAFLFGHESNGVKAETLKLVDAICEVPMYGFNKSLNVMVAAGIVLYEFISQFPARPEA